jgi:hypothetical protein
MGIDIGQQITRSSGSLTIKCRPIKDVCAQDLVAAAFKELKERQDLQPEYKRVAAIAQKWGY